MTRRLTPISMALVLAGAGVIAGAGATPAQVPDQPVDLPRVLLLPVPGAFSQPLAMDQHPESNDLYIAEKSGTIRAVRGGLLLDPVPVVNLTSEVSGGFEQGLLGLAFSPDGSFLYVSFTDTGGTSRIVEYAFDGGSVVAGSRRAVLSVPQPRTNHNGGHIAFGPDGYLYIGLGDGGGAGDPDYHSQRRETLLGNMLRIDPRPSGSEPYTVPADNPFLTHPGARPEIWAYGLRNPWKFSFDREAGDLWIADVGQNRWEEINLQRAGSPGGENYGWNHMEGLELYVGRPPGAQEPADHAPPIHVYRNVGAPGSCSITGGYVYRGTLGASLEGHYVYSDWCDGRLRTIREVNGEVVEEVELGAVVPSIASFGEDHSGELYALSLGGTVFRIIPLG